MGVSTSLQGREVEFHWCPLDQEGFLAAGWVTFRLRLQNAAERAGFSRRVAAGLTGAFGEMAEAAATLADAVAAEDAAAAGHAADADRVRARGAA